MSKNPEVISINISREKGTAKTAVPQAIVGEIGIAGDAHAGRWHRQVSLLPVESIDRFNASHGTAFGPGEFAENVTTRGVDLAAAAILDRLDIGEASLEVTQIGKECHGGGCTVFQRVGQCVMPKEGIFCRVIRGGTIRPGDKVAHHRRVLRFHVVTLSDRAAAGEYADRSGPAIREALDEFCRGRNWRAEFASAVLPDDSGQLRQALLAARDGGADAVFTTGGTGVGPRDVTPETAASVCEKLIPGIMEHIRLKCAAASPNSLLSRGIAGVAGTTQIYTLPGSPRAVGQYMDEILKTFEHLVFMVRGIDAHGSVHA